MSDPVDDTDTKASPLPGKVAVVGGGQMGTGIAHAMLLAGSEVTLMEVGDSAAEKARVRILKMLEESARRGAIARAVKAEGLLRVGTDLTRLADAGLIVEAIPEDFQAKLSLLDALERIASPECVLATNTSSFSISELASGLRRPGRFLGLHFFNPVPASRLIEIVCAPQTQPALVSVATEWVEALGKTAIVVRDSPGFVTSRLGLTIGLEAIRMLEEGIASASDIDKAMELGYKHPVGPLRLTDLVGLDVRLDIARYLEARLGPRFTPPELLQRKVKQGELGRKSGQGFYHWND